MSYSSDSSEVAKLNTSQEPLRVVVLAGGVGGAKLADGLAQHIQPDNLTIIVNTGDDFQHLGLTICPDLDTVMYTLAGVSNSQTGWGRENESWRVMAEVTSLGGPDWFALGDHDLAVHLIRSQQLTCGLTLTQATQELANQFGLRVRLLPMSDEPAPTVIVTDDGELSFQSWFVKEKWKPPVTTVKLPVGVKTSPEVVAALSEADILFIAPSNPFVSIDPILNVYPIREMANDLPEIVIAVSPIIAGQAVKGPAAKMMVELGMEVSAQSVASHYGELIDLFVYDHRDEQPVDVPGLRTLRTDTLMENREDRARLAGEILSYTKELVSQ